jgi:hypothetical protein
VSDLPERLRDLYARANGMVVDYSLILEAAREIERLEQQAADSAAWMRENMPEMYR